MKYKVERYSVHKKLIATGELTIEENGNTTILTYKDENINVRSTETENPFGALVDLRKKIDDYHNSIIAIIGCRIDTTFLGTGSHGTYIIKDCKPSMRSIGMFEPTTEIEKLGTIKEHEAAYDKWLESIMAE